MKRSGLVLISLLLASAAFAQVPRRDPLTPLETDEMREVAQEPDKRLKLILKFAKARLETVDQLRSDPRFEADRGKRVHDLLQDFTAIMDELDDNIDMYADRRDDIRKPLQDVIEGDTDFQLKLRTLKDAATANTGAEKEAREYSFALEDATEAVNSSLDNARKTLDEQIEAVKAAKDKKGKDKEKDKDKD